MDTARGIDDRIDLGGDDADGGVSEAPLDIGGDERRMHVRAYNHWVSLLKGRPYPSIEDLNPEGIADFGPNSVLIDFSQGLDDPTIRYLGAALREECGVSAKLARVAEVPSRSLLSRLTDHYLQIIANRAPIGFEAEFVGQRGHNTLYRGILMPFSSSVDTIDFIYGVINWKELVAADVQAQLNVEIEAARSLAPASAPVAPHAWADGPSAGFGDDDADADETDDTLPLPVSVTLADRLDRARESAAAARAADTRGRAALYRALGRAYDFAVAAEADADGYAALLGAAGLSVQARAPMTPAIKLVFGADYDKTRVTEFAAVLAHARRCHVAAAAFDTFLTGFSGGIKAIVRAERDLRRAPAKGPGKYETAAAALRARVPLASLALECGDEEFVLLLARQNLNGMLDVVARVEGKGLAERAVRTAA